MFVKFMFCSFLNVLHNVDFKTCCNNDSVYIQILRRILCMRMSRFYRCICETSWLWSTRETSGDAIPRTLSVGHPRYLEHKHLLNI